MNDISTTIFYNQRFIISAPISEPLAWRLTKMEDISPKGVRRLTFAQDRFDENNDYIEKNSDGDIVGMWADYWSSNIEPTHIMQDNDYVPSSITSQLTCTGKPQFKIGGSAKTFTVTYKNADGEIIDKTPDAWKFYIEENLVPAGIIQLTQLENNKVKVKFLGDDSYIGKILTVKCVSGDIVSSLDMEILPL